MRRQGRSAAAARVRSGSKQVSIWCSCALSVAASCCSAPSVAFWKYPARQYLLPIFSVSTSSPTVSPVSICRQACVQQNQEGAPLGWAEEAMTVQSLEALTLGLVSRKGAVLQRLKRSSTSPVAGQTAIMSRLTLFLEKESAVHVRKGCWLGRQARKAAMQIGRSSRSRIPRKARLTMSAWAAQTICVGISRLSELLPANCANVLTNALLRITPSPPSVMLSPHNTSNTLCAFPTKLNAAFSTPTVPLTLSFNSGVFPIVCALFGKNCYLLEVTARSAERVHLEQLREAGSRARQSQGPV